MTRQIYSATACQTVKLFVLAVLSENRGSLGFMGERGWEACAQPHEENFSSSF